MARGWGEEHDTGYQGGEYETGLLRPQAVLITSYRLPITYESDIARLREGEQ
jgi:hypothetical protein